MLLGGGIAGLLSFIVRFRRDVLTHNVVGHGPSMTTTNETTGRQKFPLGQIVATHGALDAMRSSGDSAHNLLNRHASGDWGEVCDDDKRLNDDAVHDGERLLSAYRLKGGTKLWIITEADRSVTTYLLPDEY